MRALSERQVAVVCTADIQPIGVTDVAASVVTDVAATIAWTTSEAADTQVEFGPTVAYGASTPLDSHVAWAHAAQLTGLQPGTH